MNIPIPTLETMIYSAELLLGYADSPTSSDYAQIYESSTLLKTRMMSLDLAHTPRGDTFLLHQLHSPLNIIMAYTDLLLEHRDPGLSSDELALIGRINEMAITINEFILEHLA